MTAFYDLTSAGSDPVSLADMKTYLKVPGSADDTLITALITVATEYGEKYTGREFRANTWKLLLDAFSTRIVLNRMPVDSITSVKYLKATVLTAVVDSTYYLKELVSCAQILLNVDKEWPTDIDEREQGVEIIFDTKKYTRSDKMIDLAIKTHVAYVYYNRGDCPSDAPGAIFATGKKSGADSLYNTFRISRV